MTQNVPEFSAAIKKSNYSGDFLAMFARSSIDQQIARLIEEKWRKFDQRHRLKPADSTTSTSEQDWQKFHLKPVSIRSLGKGKVTSTEDLHKHINMLRSDHLHFWYHNHSSYAESLSAVLLTDTGTKLPSFRQVKREKGALTRANTLQVHFEGICATATTRCAMTVAFSPSRMSPLSRRRSMFYLL